MLITLLQTIESTDCSLRWKLRCYEQVLRLTLLLASTLILLTSDDSLGAIQFMSPSLDECWRW